jgi:hypothetical protein
MNFGNNECNPPVLSNGGQMKSQSVHCYFSLVLPHFSHKHIPKLIKLPSLISITFL